MSDNNSSSCGGVGLGTVLAGILSWMKWHSVTMLIIHGMCGWIYVVYYLIRYGFPS